MPDQPIVVGYDGSPISREALDFALATAKPSKTPIEIVQAWTASKPSSKDATDGSPAAETVLAEAIEYAKGAAPEIDVTGQLVPGDAVDALLQAAEHASIVVLGSRGLGGFSGLLVGSTGVKVATQATCPVVVVRPREAVRCSAQDVAIRPNSVRCRSPAGVSRFVRCTLMARKGPVPSVPRRMAHATCRSASYAMPGAMSSTRT